jgi:putative spermidine/putrescine transport system ATP-binding protein
VTLGDTVLRTSRSVPQVKTLSLAVHSEKLVVADESDQHSTNLLSGTVTETLYQGESIRVFLKLSSGGELSLRLPSNHAGRLHLKQPGEPITVALHPDDTIVVPDAS